MIGATKLLILISVWMTLIFTQVTVVWEKKWVSIFSEISQLIWMKFSKMLQPVGVLKLMLNLFCRSNIQGRELCWYDFIKHMINIALCQDTCGSICFKLGMMLDMTKLYSLIPVWLTLILVKGHRVMGKLELVKSFCCTVAWHNKCSWWLIM